MSRCCCKTQTAYTPMPVAPAFGGGNNCICSLPTLVILILIILQFSRYGRRRDYDCDDDDGYRGCGNIIDNGVLFIIALFFLSCVGCGGRGCAGGFGGFGGYGARY